MFGDNDYEEWKDLLQEYQAPPFSLPGCVSLALPQYSFVYQNGTIDRCYMWVKILILACIWVPPPPLF
jgi:hypothetical protein